MFRRHCEKCGGDLEMVAWLPEEGLDPNLRKLKCSRCDQEEYQALTPREAKKLELELLEKRGP